MLRIGLDVAVEWREPLSYLTIKDDGIEDAFFLFKQSGKLPPEKETLHKPLASSPSSSSVR